MVNPILKNKKDKKTHLFQLKYTNLELFDLFNSCVCVCVRKIH